MISIVICSISPQFLLQVTRSIEETLGMPFEILAWDNRVNSLGICEVYNKMAVQAKFEYILFLHEDVVFTREGWGKEIYHFFENHKDVGLIGVAGASYFSSFFSGWFTGKSEIDFFSVVHRTNGKEFQLKSTSSANRLKEVVCLDGVFLFCRKSIWEKVKFNDHLLKGFHFYDIDFSQRVAEICRVFAFSNVPLVHITKGGDYGDKWVIEAIKYHLYKFNSGTEFSNSSVSQLDKEIALKWLDLLKYQKISIKNRINWITLQHLIKFPSMYFGIMKFLFYRISGLGWVHQQLKSCIKNLIEKNGSN